MNRQWRTEDQNGDRADMTLFVLASSPAKANGSPLNSSKTGKKYLFPVGVRLFGLTKSSDSLSQGCLDLVSGV